MIQSMQMKHYAAQSNFSPKDVYESHSYLNYGFAKKMTASGDSLTSPSQITPKPTLTISIKTGQQTYPSSDQLIIDKAYEKAPDSARSKSSDKSSKMSIQ